MTAKALVWFKRDLRVRDHAALAAAARCEEALALYVFEPAWFESPEFDPQHATFAHACITELRYRLDMLGLPLLVCAGDAVQVLSELRATYAFTHLFSHEETGSGWTYTRDKAVARYCKARGVHWQEFPQTGVVRPMRQHRDAWNARWQARMTAPEIAAPESFRAARGISPGRLISLDELGVAKNHRPMPAAGEAAAWDVLVGFLAERGRDCRRAMSTPTAARDNCSRLSSYLAFGTISMRCVHQATETRITHAGDAQLANGLRAFARRLRWHCHFMQRLEDDPAIEFRNMARSYDGLRPGDHERPMGEADHEKLVAWQEGRTGYPMVDASMRFLCATGWLNFRMRALLASFASYHLWLHWRPTGLFLAQQFLDFEPGIHWGQLQMHAGTSGINTLRMYSPARQLQGSQGAFIRRWVPEWGTAAYPPPIVDEEAALKRARRVLYSLRRTVQAREEADAIALRQGSRKRGFPRVSRSHTVDETGQSAPHGR